MILPGTFFWYWCWSMVHSFCNWTHFFYFFWINHVYSPFQICEANLYSSLFILHSLLWFVVHKICFIYFLKINTYYFSIRLSPVISSGFLFLISISNIVGARSAKRPSFSFASFSTNINFRICCMCCMRFSCCIVYHLFWISVISCN